MLLTLSLACLLADPVLESGLPAGMDFRTLTVDGVKRGYLLHIPNTLPAMQKVPLVLVLHGAGLNARLIMMMTQFHAKANDEGFIVAFPNGTGPANLLLTWNADGCCGTAVSSKVDDVTFLESLIDELAARQPIDLARVYVAGLSNGGMMAYRLAVEIPQRLAAVASVAGPLATVENLPTKPLPIMHIHGTADPIVPYGGRNDLPDYLRFRSVEETLRIWKELNRSSETASIKAVPDMADDGTESAVLYWRPQDPKGKPVVHIRVTGGGHPWPGEAIHTPRLGPVARDFKATDFIWDFFKTQKRQ